VRIVIGARTRMGDEDDSKGDSNFLEVYDLAGKDAVTYNTYVPLACSDVHRLDTSGTILRRAGADARGANSALFFGNHPIKWVQLAGTAADVYYMPGDEPRECDFAVADGLGGPPVRCSVSFRNAPARARIKTGDLVLVWAQLVSVSRARVVRLAVVPPALVFLLRDEALATRKYVLEKDANRFRGLVPVLKSIETPKLKVCDVVSGEMYPVHTFLRRRARLWETDPAMARQIWPN